MPPMGRREARPAATPGPAAQAQSALTLLPSRHARRGRASSFGPWLQLTRPRLGILVALSAATAFVLASGRIAPAALIPATACFLLAAGATALNQYQERHLDARMTRTCTRPLPAGRISPGAALAFGIALILLALGVLLLLGGSLAALAGALAVFWYNGLYTWLKRRSAFAAVPGALVGSLGPAIGWLAGGGAPGSPSLLLLMVILFLWQVPHFWLLALRHAEEYQRAGYPTPVERLGGAHLGRVTFVWLLAAAMAALMLPLFGLMQRLDLYLFLCGLCLLLGIASRGLLRVQAPGERLLRRSFMQINLFALATLVLLLVDRGLRP